MRKYCPEVIKEVMTLKEKHTIIKLKEEGHSDREIQRLTGIHRKTVAKYWSEHQANLASLGFNEELREIQELIVSAPKYNSSKRSKIKYTKEIDAMLDSILSAEEAKDALLGDTHKQKLTGVQIHALISAAGYDIGLTTITDHIRDKKNLKKEAFIKQQYEYGKRVEYDFGEVKLEIAGSVNTYHMAVISSPAAGFRWAYLYHSQKKEVFLDSHVRFFEMAAGVYDEVVYDNMKNVVTKFIGRTEKQLNDDLIKMSLYYGFKINVTNCYSGNEKGHVEGSVKIIRNKVFATKYRFDSFSDAETYLDVELKKMNAESEFEEEKKHLLAYRPPLELANISNQSVDKYSFVRVENNFYSVPDYLVGREVTVKNYLSEIVVYSNGNKVCTHKKKMGFGEASVEIHHYLDTLTRKPGAIKNSVALKSKKELKELFDIYFTGREKEFIEILKENTCLPYPELIIAVKTASDSKKSRPSGTIEENVAEKTKSSLAELSNLFITKREGSHVN